MGEYQIWRKEHCGKEGEIWRFHRTKMQSELIECLSAGRPRTEPSTPDRPHCCLLRVLLLPPTLPPALGHRAQLPECQLRAWGRGSRRNSWELCFQTDRLTTFKSRKLPRNSSPWDLPSTPRPYSPITQKC